MFCRLVEQQIFHRFADVRTRNTTNSFDRRNRLKETSNSSPQLVHRCPSHSRSMVSCEHHWFRITLRPIHTLRPMWLGINVNNQTHSSPPIRIELVRENCVLDAFINWICLVTRNVLESLNDSHDQINLHFYWCNFALQESNVSRVHAFIDSVDRCRRFKAIWPRCTYIMCSCCWVMVQRKP